MECDDKDFMSLINFNGLNNYDKLTWTQIVALKSLHRNRFPSELFWRQNEGCSGFVVSENGKCPLRHEELSLIMYTPEECQTGKI